MKTWTVLASAALAVTAALVIAAPVPPGGADQPAERWEYAELASVRAGGVGGVVIVGPGVPGVPGGGVLPGPAAVPMAAGGKISWVTGKDAVEAESWEDLAEKLKVAEGPKSDNPAVYKLRVLNHVGGQGWEMVSATQTPLTVNGVSPGMFVFKRKAK